LGEHPHFYKRQLISFQWKRSFNLKRVNQFAIEQAPMLFLSSIQAVLVK
jgi:hypothetical protein